MNVDESTVVLGIESSCDETAAAVVMGGADVLSSVVASQVDEHARFGGVVPEVASRAHLESIMPVVRAALERAHIGFDRVDAVAATAGPGLVGALLVGLTVGKCVAMALSRPFVAVNHLEAHLYASQLEEPDLEPPMLVLLVSGGNTLLVHVRGHGDYEVVGRTLDDAAGEAFDKVARFLELGHPGGPAIDRLSQFGDPAAIAFPRGMVHDGLDVSFSGLKTAVVNHVRAHPGCASADVAASFQEAVVDVLVTKTVRAAEMLDVNKIAIGGGVAANSRLRARLQDESNRRGWLLALPSRALCTDNAAMIAAAGWHRLRSTGPSDLATGARPNLRLGEQP